MFPLAYCPSLGFQITALSVCTPFQLIFTKLYKKTVPMNDTGDTKAITQRTEVGHGNRPWKNVIFSGKYSCTM
jgi:hypothetical protein